MYPNESNIGHILNKMNDTDKLKKVTLRFSSPAGALVSLDEKR